MAKRFTDTEIWDKEWFMDLPSFKKCLVRYVFDKCDVAGIWSPNWKLASLYIGEPVTEGDLLSIGNGLFLRLESGKIFVSKFCSFQYGTLSENCAPHKKVIQILNSNGLDPTLTEGYSKGILTLQDKDMDKDIDKDREMDKVKKPKTEKFNPLDHIPENWNCDLFLAEWSDFMIMRHRKKWACTDSILISRIKQLRTLSGDEWDKALPMLQKSTEKGYAEFFAPDRNGPTNTSQIRKIKDERQPAIRDRA